VFVNDIDALFEAKELVLQREVVLHPKALVGILGSIFYAVGLEHLRYLRF
jgi:hypothetical protein